MQDGGIARRIAKRLDQRHDCSIAADPSQRLDNGGAKPCRLRPRACRFAEERNQKRDVSDILEPAEQRCRLGAIVQRHAWIADRSS
jgi:hypothetical protein